jgi:adenine-specific DNA glycosylase
VAHRDGLEEEIPEPRATRQPEHQVWVAACLCRSDGALFLRRIDSGNLLRGLWLPPIAQVKGVEELQEAASRLMPRADAPFRVLPPLRHSITYRRMQVHPVVGIAASEITAAGEGEMWFVRGGRQIPSSSLLEKIFSRLEQGGFCRSAAF